MSPTSASVRGRNAISLFIRVEEDRGYESRCIPSQERRSLQICRQPHTVGGIRGLVNKTCKNNDVPRADQGLDECTTCDGNSGFPLARHDDSVDENDSIIIVASLQPQEPSPVELPKQTIIIFTRSTTRTRFQLTITTSDVLHIPLPTASA